MRDLLAGLFAIALFAGAAWAQQAADPQADLSVAQPASSSAHAPHLVIDGGHNNFHTVDGRYAPFAQLMRNDGMRVDGSTGPFTDQSLEGVDVLVIANAIASINVDNW